jgi:four helix bundle protein
MEGMIGCQEDWMEVGRVSFEKRKNINRGYRNLVVWQDAIDFYALTCERFRGFPFVLQRVASQQIASVDSIHRNIAEGYCRRSLKEYLHFLNIALSSVGESVSGLHAYRTANQLSEMDFEQLDKAAWKLENGLKRLIQSLQAKQQTGEWQDSFVKEEAPVDDTAFRETPWQSVGICGDWKEDDSHA